MVQLLLEALGCGSNGTFQVKEIGDHVDKLTANPLDVGYGTASAQRASGDANLQPFGIVTLRGGQDLPVTGRLFAVDGSGDVNPRRTGTYADTQSGKRIGTHCGEFDVRLATVGFRGKRQLVILI